MRMVDEGAFEKSGVDPYTVGQLVAGESVLFLVLIFHHQGSAMLPLPPSMQDSQPKLHSNSWLIISIKMAYNSFNLSQINSKMSQQYSTNILYKMATDNFLMG